mmetsp:Transcript_1548/g.2776  ORF Transcript_1548/g.2776 Transcript_1548/m.2776 type:complete len:196 (-) Transcript_1548:181-768(-)
MMSGSGGNGGGDVRRRTWEKAAFARRAEQRKLDAELTENELQRARKARGEHSDETRSVKNFEPTRAWLQSRKHAPQLDVREGTSQIISHVRDTNSGFHCSVCDVLLKDSHAFLNHLNGKPHQKKLGMTMRVKRDTVSDVRAALQKHGATVVDSNPKQSENQSRDDTKDSDHHEHSDEADWASELGLPSSFGNKKH